MYIQICHSPQEDDYSFRKPFKTIANPSKLFNDKCERFYLILEYCRITLVTYKVSTLRQLQTHDIYLLKLVCQTVTSVGTLTLMVENCHTKFLD